MHFLPMQVTETDNTVYKNSFTQNTVVTRIIEESKIRRQQIPLAKEQIKLN